MPRLPVLRPPSARRLILVLVLLAGSASAVEVSGLYTAEVPLDPKASNPRDAAYQLALYDVLLRVSGSELADDTALVESLFPDPSSYVTQFRPGADDTLVVSFDGEALTGALRAAGQTVWGSERPLTLVWLAVDWGEGEREILGVDDPLRDDDEERSIDRNRLLRERLFALGERLGVPLLLPLLDAEDMGQVSYADIRGGFDEIVMTASERYDVDSVLIGVVDAEAIEPNRWRYYFGPDRHNWRGEPEQVVPLVAGLLADEFAVQGNAPLRTVTLSVSGIQTVEAYGDLQQRLENVPIIERFAIDRVEGDRITYDVEVRGGASRLARALRFAGLLEADRIDGDFGVPAGQPGFDESLEFFFEPR